MAIMSRLRVGLFVTLFIWTSLMNVVDSKTFNAKTFTDANVINFTDALTNGFRIILSDEFLKHSVNPLSMSTLYVSAIPLRQGEPRFTTVLYPDVVYADKQVVVKGLREKSWYYVCIEWESYGRHNETMGCVCRLYRTLDRFAKGATSAVTDVEIVPVDDAAAGDAALAFRLRVDADFPLRLTAYLTGGAASAPAQNFFTRRPTDVDVRFPFLAAATDYGQMCLVEEATPVGYTAMGRLIRPELKERCYFKQLRTKPRLSYTISDQPDTAVAHHLRVAGGGGPAVQTAAGHCALSVVLSLWSALLWHNV